MPASLTGPARDARGNFRHGRARRWNFFFCLQVAGQVSSPILNGTSHRRGAGEMIRELSGIDRFGMVAALALLIGLSGGLSGCADSSNPELPTADLATDDQAPLYRIGPLDSLEIFVWRNQELSRTVTVRPDGRITVPLVEDLYVSNKTPSELAKEIEQALAVYIQDPLVTVMVAGFNGPFDQQVRIVGAAEQPKAIPFQAEMTLLDVMIQVGGLTEFADGDNTTLVRLVDGEMREYNVRVDSLVRDGDISANVAMFPGDILIIPESFL